VFSFQEFRRAMIVAELADDFRHEGRLRAYVRVIIFGSMTPSPCMVAAVQVHSRVLIDRQSLDGPIMISLCG